MYTFTHVHAQIAQELDAMEKALLGGTSEAGEHGNVDASGMFSVQVGGMLNVDGCSACRWACLMLLSVCLVYA